MKIFIIQGPPSNVKDLKVSELYKDDIKHRTIISRKDVHGIISGDSLYTQNFNTAVEEARLGSYALSRGISPIINDINLDEHIIKYWEHIAKSYNIQIDFIECVAEFNKVCDWDKHQNTPEGDEIIEKFYSKYYPDMLNNIKYENRLMRPFTDKQKAIIVDIDGTVALRNNRSPFNYDLVLSDKPDFRVCEIINTLSKTYEIIFITGRRDVNNCKKDTIEWINTNIPSLKNTQWYLYMRPNNDPRRPDQEIKREIYINKIKPYYDVVAVLDDRNKVVDMWRNEGLLCMQVYYGNF